MLTDTMRAVLIFTLVAIEAGSVTLARAADTVIFAATKYALPPGVAEYRIASDGSVIRLPGISSATRPGHLAVGADGKIYVVEFLDEVNSAIVVYAPGANGNVAPLAVIAGPRTGLRGTSAIAVDARGTIYVTNVGTNSVTVYAPGSTGDVAPIATINGSNTGLDHPLAVAVDSSGKTYVANGQRGLTVYSAGSNGDAKPVAAITGKNIYVGDVALDASGRIYTTNGKNSINVYKAGSISSAPPIASLPNPGVNLYPGGFAVDAGGKIYLTSTEMHHGGSSNKVVVYPAAVNGADTTPVATITSDSIQTYFLTGIAVGPDGKIYVALGLGSRIEVFPPASNGNVKTIATITSTATGITEPHGIAVGADGKIYIVNKEVTPHSCGSLLVFARDSYGDVPPIATIVGPHTGLQNPNGVAVDRTGNVYVINQVGVQQCGPHHSTVADIDPSTRFAPITAYSAAAIASGGGDVKPVAGIDGLDSGFYTSTSIAVDSRGRVYTTVWQPNQVIIYPSGANGDAAPAATITGDQTRLDNPVAVALDSKGNIYVANRGGGLNFTAKTEPSINVYPPDSNGNAKPIAIIEGEKTGLVNDAISLAVNGSGTLCAANPFRINVFSLDANGNVAPIATITGPKMIGATGQLTGIAIGPAAP